MMMVQHQIQSAICCYRGDARASTITLGKDQIRALKRWASDHGYGSVQPTHVQGLEIIKAPVKIAVVVG